MEQVTTKKCNQGYNVKRWREWRGINQDVLAEKIGISQATLSSYEKKAALEPEILEKLAKALDIPTEAVTELGVDASVNIFSGTWQDNSSANGYVHTQTFN